MAGSRGRGLGTVHAGLGRLCEGRVWGPAFLGLPQRRGGSAGAGPEPTAARSPTSPEHVLRAPDLHRRPAPAAERGFPVPDPELPATPVSAPRGRGLGGTGRRGAWPDAAGAWPGRGALGSRQLACQVTRRAAAAKNRNAGRRCRGLLGNCSSMFVLEASFREREQNMQKPRSMRRYSVLGGLQVTCEAGLWGPRKKWQELKLES